METCLLDKLLALGRGPYANSFHDEVFAHQIATAGGTGSAYSLPLPGGYIRSEIRARWGEARRQAGRATNKSSARSSAGQYTGLRKPPRHPQPCGVPLLCSRAQTWSNLCRGLYTIRNLHCTVPTARAHAKPTPDTSECRATVGAKGVHTIVVRISFTLPACDRNALAGEAAPRPPRATAHHTAAAQPIENLVQPERPLTMICGQHLQRRRRLSTMHAAEITATELAQLMEERPRARKAGANNQTARSLSRKVGATRLRRGPADGQRKPLFN